MMQRQKDAMAAMGLASLYPIGLVILMTFVFALTGCVSLEKIDAAITRAGEISDHVVERADQISERAVEVAKVAGETSAKIKTAAKEVKETAKQLKEDAKETAKEAKKAYQEASEVE